MNKIVLFSATLREVRFLLENDYLNEKGKKWANGFEEKEQEQDCCEMDALTGKDGVKE